MGAGSQSIQIIKYYYQGIYFREFQIYVRNIFQSLKQSCSHICQLIINCNVFQNTNRVPYYCRFHIYARRGILSHAVPEHAEGALTSLPKVPSKKSISSSKSNAQSMSSSSSSSSYSSSSSNAVRPTRVCFYENFVI